jgi:hypothetical protein
VWLSLPRADVVPMSEARLAARLTSAS